MERGLPRPSAELIINGALLIELEIALRELGLKKPGFTERVLLRIQSQALRSTVTRLRGPRASADTLEAIDAAEAWAGEASVIVRAMRRA